MYNPGPTKQNVAFILLSEFLGSFFSFVYGFVLLRVGGSRYSIVNCFFFLAATTVLILTIEVMGSMGILFWFLLLLGSKMYTIIRDSKDRYRLAEATKMNEASLWLFLFILVILTKTMDSTQNPTLWGGLFGISYFSVLFAISLKPVLAGFFAASTYLRR